jgi:hypothetical protein
VPSGGLWGRPHSPICFSSAVGTAPNPGRLTRISESPTMVLAEARSWLCHTAFRVSRNRADKTYGRVSISPDEKLVKGNPQHARIGRVDFLVCHGDEVLTRSVLSENSFRDLGNLPRVTPVLSSFQRCYRVRMTRRPDLQSERPAQSSINRVFTNPPFREHQHDVEWK